MATPGTSHSGGPLVQPFDRKRIGGHSGEMTGLMIILLIVGIVLLLLGVFVAAAKFLLWIDVVIIVIAVIAWLLRFIRRGSLTPRDEITGTPLPMASIGPEDASRPRSR